MATTHFKDEQTYEKLGRLYTAASVSSSVGTPTGTVANTQTMLDGNTYDVVEAAATPAMTIDFTWAGVTLAPYILIVRAQYDGGSTHNLRVEIYNYATVGWVALHQIPTSLDFIVHRISLPVMTNFLSAGAAQVRFNHASAGNPAHDLHIDYIAFRAR